MINSPLKAFALLSGVLVGLLASGSSNQASAATMTLNDCPLSFIVDGTARVHDGLATPGVQTAATRCQYLTPPDSSIVASEANVNEAGFFEITTWDSLLKINLPDWAPGTVGVWWIPGTVDFSTYHYMLTFKDGRDTNLISFLLSGEYKAGVWDSPFTDPPFEFSTPKTKDVSHYTVFRSSRAVGVPEPGTMTLAMYGLGIVGAGFLLLRDPRRPRPR